MQDNLGDKIQYTVEQSFLKEVWISGAEVEGLHMGLHWGYYLQIQLSILSRIFSVLHPDWIISVDPARFRPGLALKNPPKKTHPKKPQKTHLKKPTKNGFFGFFLVFLIFLFFMKIIQTFLFQTDFLWTNK